MLYVCAIVLTCLRSCSITPIFTLSSVSGESLDLLKVFFNIIPPLSNSKEQEELMQQLTEFQVRQLPGTRCFRDTADTHALHTHNFDRID